jgi:hypothetical protein
LFSLFQQGSPDPFQLGLKTGRYKLIHRAGDDLISQQLQQLAGAEAGIHTIAVVVGDEDGLGRMVKDSAEQQLKFF